MMSEFKNQCVIIFLNEFSHLVCIRCCACTEWSAASLSPLNSVFILKLLDYVLDRYVMKASRATKPFTKLFAHYIAQTGLKINSSADRSMLLYSCMCIRILLSHTHRLMIQSTYFYRIPCTLGITFFAVQQGNRHNFLKHSVHRFITVITCGSQPFKLLYISVVSIHQ